MFKPWWICSKCGYSYQAIISNRTRGRGCPVCRGLKVTTLQNCFATKFPELAKEWHPTKNGNFTPYHIRPKSEKRAWWLCPKCKWEWYVTVATRSSGRGCPSCFGRAVTPQNCLASKNPALASEWHPTKNGELTPSDVRPRSGKKVWWKCKKCKHEWQAKIYGRGSGDGSGDGSPGCPGCSGRVATPENCLAVKFPKLIKEWHPTRNKKLTPYDVTPGSTNKVWWLCKKCKYEWQANIGHRSAGSGCPACVGYAVTSRNSLSIEYPQLVKEWHPTKNGKMTPSDVVSGSNKKVWWRCSKCKHEWRTKINSRTSGGHGCHACAGKIVTPQNCLATKNPELAKEWHPTKNNGFTPYDLTVKSDKEAWWLCKKCGNEWKRSPSYRHRVVGCISCKKRRKNNV